MEPSVLKKLLSGLLLASLVACASTPPPAPAPVAGTPAGFLVRDPTFTYCELEAFVAHDAARQTLLFGQGQEAMLANAKGDASLTQLINEIFRQVKEEGLEDHARFASAQFYQCVDREKLSLPRNPGGAAVCLARTDIVFFLNADRQRGKSPEEANQRLKDTLRSASQTVYPHDLIDQLTPMAYRIQNEDDHYELRRFVFETCLVPKDWRDWWNSTHEEKVQ